MLNPQVKEYFRLDDVGVEPLGDYLPLTAFELLGYELKRVSDDVLRWWLGDWMVILADQHGVNAYERMAAQIFDGQYKSSTMETMAYVARNVPKAIRKAELKFWTHKLVASKSVEEQREWLDKAVREGIGHNDLARLIYGEDHDVEPKHTTFTEDLQFEVALMTAERDKIRQQLHDFADEAQATFSTIEFRLDTLYEYIQACKRGDEVLDLDYLEQLVNEMRSKQNVF